jgi:hypothetical protein
MKKSIKELKFGDLIKFDNHHHCVFNDQIDCSNMVGLVIDVSQPTKPDERHMIVIKLKSRKHAKDLEDWDNSLSFNFPDDEDHYNDVKVNLIK